MMNKEEKLNCLQKNFDHQKETGKIIFSSPVEFRVKKVDIGYRADQLIAIIDVSKLYRQKFGKDVKVLITEKYAKEGGNHFARSALALVSQLNKIYLNFIANTQVRPFWEDAKFEYKSKISNYDEVKL